MKKRLLSGLLALLLVASTLSSYAAATGETADSSGITPFASLYLSSHAIGISAKGGGKLLVSYLVSGTRTMDKIGAYSIVIEELVGNTWYPYLTYLGSDNASFYSTQTADHVAQFTVTAFPGGTYRAVLVAHAILGAGSDKSDPSPSQSVLCK